MLFCFIIRYKGMPYIPTCWFSRQCIWRNAVCIDRKINIELEKENKESRKGIRPWWNERIRTSNGTRTKSLNCVVRITEKRHWYVPQYEHAVRISCVRIRADMKRNQRCLNCGNMWYSIREREKKNCVLWFKCPNLQDTSTFFMSVLSHSVIV